MEENRTSLLPEFSIPEISIPEMPNIISSSYSTSTDNSSMMETLGLSNLSLEGSDEFLNSNSMIAKFGFIILILILFVFLLRLGISLLSWIFSPNNNPILLNGMIDAKQMVQIPQDPKATGSIPILRSVNEREGMAFTWSVWIHIDDLIYKDNEYKHIFHKGNDNINLENKPYGMNFPNNAPGLYIAPNKNDLVVVMNTFEEINEEIIVKNIPLNKWVNVIIRVNEQREMDIYINGKLTRRHIFKSVPKQNYGDVFISMNGGFSGYVSKLQYFSSSISINDIESIVSSGPNTNSLTKKMDTTIPDYLSMRWFFDNNIN